jgi:transcriptional regulator with XRE-family HTH domain
MTSFEPTVRRQQLGAALRTLRKAAGFTLDDAGEVINCSASKVSRIETGHRTVSPIAVSALVAVYAADHKTRDRLIALAQDSHEIGWLQRSMDYEHQEQALMTLESKAESIVNFQLGVVPGLLQTGEYAQAFVSEMGMYPESESRECVVNRLQRQSVLLRRDPPKLLAIIDELVLYRLVGSPGVLRRQLHHLVEESNRPNVSLRVVPNDGQTHGGVDSPFVVIRRPGLSPVVLVETLTSNLFVEDRSEVDAYELVLQKLLNRALSEEESVSLVASVARRLDTEVSNGWSPPTYEP